jgi:hypothetical protein
VDRTPTIPEIVAVLLLAPPEAPWANEGRCRALIRRHLCLTGWRWAKADRESRRLIANGRLKAKIRMPAGWDVNVWPGQWPSCAICDRPFPRSSPLRKYCSDLCNWRAYRIRSQLDLGPIQLRCSHCADLIIDPQPNQIFCGKSCRRTAESARISAIRRDVKEERDRICLDCGAPLLLELKAMAKFCNHACQLRFFRRTRDQDWRDRNNARRRERRKLNGHANGHDHAPDADRPAAADRPELAGVAAGARSDLPRGDADRARGADLDAASTAARG